MTVAGIAWFSKVQWDHLRRISTDKIEDTWEEWAANAERTLARLKKEGMMIDMVPVDVSELELWCRSTKKKCDSAARAEYVTRKLNSK